MVRAAQIVAGVAALTLAAGLLLASRGTVSLFDPVRAGAPPAWTRPCLTTAPREDRQLLRLCARVEGRVVWIDRASDDVHFAVLARGHLFVVKSDRAPKRLSTARVVGPLVRASDGQREIVAVTVSES
jgi:hypothetical protein